MVRFLSAGTGLLLILMVLLSVVVIFGVGVLSLKLDSTGGIPSLIVERFVVKTELIVVVSVVVEGVLNVVLVSVVSSIFSASKFSSIFSIDLSANFLIKSAIFAAIVLLAPSLITLLKESK